MDTSTDSKIRLLLRILRNPLVSLLVLYYGLFYVRTSGLIYITWNYTMGKVYSFNISGTEAQGLFKATLSGPELLTGGSAGMEGSLIAMLVGVTFTVVMLILAVRRGNIVPPPWKRRIVRPGLDT